MKCIFNFQNVIFPSITICNLNLVEASLFKNLSAFDDQVKKQQIIRKYIEGTKDWDYSKWNQELDDQIQDKITSTHFLGIAMQKCNDLFIHIKFQSKDLTWKEIKSDKYSSIGPRNTFTDNGRCCFFSPHMMMDIYDKSDGMLYHNLKGTLQIVLNMYLPAAELMYNHVHSQIQTTTEC